MNRFLWRSFFMLLLLTANFGATSLTAQISPGRLAQPHAELDGNQNCLSCHRTRRGVDPQRCLSCHTGLRDRIQAKLGLHALPEYQACESCHIDHQGRAFELIWWGEGGQETFDHTVTGWPLRESHAQTACTDCHTPDLLADQQALRLETGSFSAERTFQGLSTQCADCHADAHFGQFDRRPCSDCHSQTAFSEVNFDHDSASFPLSGEHLNLDCSACHKETTNPSSEIATHQLQKALVGLDALLGVGHTTRYADLPHAECGSCHSDPHANRLGASCSKCHDTSGFSSITTATFDHSLTNYPLAGKHRSVVCASCHRTDFSLARPQSSACTDCHQDVHLGQLTDHQGVRPCEDCHSLQGFSPTTFGSPEHQETNFPLNGAHLDTACEGCHQRFPADQLANQLADLLAQPKTPATDLSLPPLPLFRVEHETCQACHEDPHDGSFVPATDQGCVSCHDTEAWWSVSFQHRSTGFPLQAGHAGLDCVACHAPDADKDQPGALGFSQTPSSCAGCHADPHGGQFMVETSTGALVACERCHGSRAFAPSKFDHQNDARFPLEGAHLEVACSDCHAPGSSNAIHSVLYRPLARECASCHANAPKERNP